MNTTDKKKVILGAFLFAMLLTIPLTLSLLSKQQKSNTHAAGGTTSLSFTPASSTSAPIQTSVGSTVDLDLYVDPGTNLVTFVRYQATFDPTKVQLVSATPADLNTAIFTNVEGPVVTSGTIAQSVSIGSDPTKVITKKTKVATLHFTAVGGTGTGTTTISFGTLSQALSSGSTDQASQNVLSTTSPAVLAISGTGTVPSPTQGTVPTITGTALKFSLLLDGVGSAGDNPNPTGNSLSNKNPLHPQRNLNVQVFNTSNQIVASSAASLAFDSGSGMFIGAVGLPTSVQTGSYSIKVQTDRYLRKLAPGIQQITSGQETPVATIRLVTGDTNTDNVLNVLDYNALLDCGYGKLTPLPINDPNSIFKSAACQVHQPPIDVDLNDDGIIDSTDYNLFLRELSVQNGD